MKEKLAKANIESYERIEELITRPYKITISQVMKNCKLSNDQFKKVINLTRAEHSRMEEIHLQFQKKYYYPEYVLAEKRTNIIHK